jgi:hypothetical protein
LGDVFGETDIFHPALFRNINKLTKLNPIVYLNKYRKLNNVDTSYWKGAFGKH